MIGDAHDNKRVIDSDETDILLPEGEVYEPDIATSMSVTYKSEPTRFTAARSATIHYIANAVTLASDLRGDVYHRSQLTPPLEYRSEAANGQINWTSVHIFSYPYQLEAPSQDCRAMKLVIGQWPANQYFVCVYYRETLVHLP